jgi:hypothetical protein
MKAALCGHANADLQRPLGYESEETSVASLRVGFEFAVGGESRLQMTAWFVEFLCRAVGPAFYRTLYISPCPAVAWSPGELWYGFVPEALRKCVDITPLPRDS